MLAHLATQFAALALPDLAACALSFGIPLVLSVLAWPLLRTRRHAPAAALAPVQSKSAGHGLAGQWLQRTRELEGGLARLGAAVRLHQAAELRLGALDYEIDRLWREARAVMAVS